MNVLRCLFFVLLTSSVAASQTTKPAKPKPQPEKLILKPEIIEQILQQQQKIDFEIIAPGIRNQNEAQVRPWIRAEQPQELVLGWGRPIVNPRFNSEKDFKPFIDEQIQAMKSQFKLSEVNVRKLKLAAKGVAHRAMRKAEPKKRSPNEVIVFALGNQPPPRDMSATFQSRLNNSKLWNATVSKVLTKKQQTEWQKVVTTIAPNLKPPTLPAVVVLPAAK